GYIILERGGPDAELLGRGPIANNLEPDEIVGIAELAGLDGGDVVFFAAGPKPEAERLAGAARQRIGAELGLVEQGAFRFYRIVMLLADTPNIREGIVFPMNQQARDLMMRAPAPVPPERLRELHIRLDLPPPKPR